MGKRIKIGVISNATYSDYSAAIIDGIQKYCKENDCVQIVFPVIRYLSGGRYKYQYDTMLKLINSHNVDVLIVCSASFSGCKIDSLIEEIKRFPPIPIISLGLKLPEIPSVIIESSKAITSIIEHVINVHARKKFLLMAANLTNVESKQRVKVLKKTLEKNKIPFSNENILYGKFNFEDAYFALTSYIKANPKRDFDAIFCCNDDMALGCIGALEDNNIHVPEDVCVIGFDNIYGSRRNGVSIATVDQLLEQQGQIAAEMAVEFVKKRTLSTQLKVIDAKPIYRQSCGCIENSIENIVAESRKDLLKKNIHYNSSTQLYMLHFFLIESQTLVPLDKLYTRLAYCFSLFDIASAILVLYDKPVYVTEKTTFVVPNKATLKMIYSKTKGIITSEEKFNPTDNMIPESCDAYLADMQFIFPIYAENNQYGYFIMKEGQYEKIFYQTMFELISNEIIASLRITQTENERSKLQIRNITLEEYSEKLEMLSRTDEMTQILNRRGFYEDAQMIINRATANGQTGLVVFCDMDGLKCVNDTFGHEAGDRAIKAEAKILTDIFRGADIVGRLGGDEFAVVAPDLTKKEFGMIKKRLKERCKQYNDLEVEPFVLSMSIGCTEFSKDQTNLDILLNKADEKLYQEKRKKKLKRKL